jgi:hypothetical protein
LVIEEKIFLAVVDVSNGFFRDIKTLDGTRRRDIGVMRHSVR